MEKRTNREYQISARLRQIVGRELVYNKDHEHLMRSAQSPTHIESAIDVICYEIDNWSISESLEYYYWDALADVQRPGKFEGQRAYVPFFYTALMDDYIPDEVLSLGEGAGEVFCFKEAREICAWHGVQDTMYFAETEQGFFIEIRAKDFEAVVDEVLTEEEEEE